jgi:uncharacterized protein (TIGR02001 family)
MRPTIRFALAFALLHAPAEAAEVGGTGLTVSGDVILLSDYRYRGISRSRGRPALQGDVTLSKSGFYAGAKATSLRREPLLGEAEVDFYAGWGKQLRGGTSLDSGILYYAFPGAPAGSGYFEPYASISHQIGPLEATAGAKYAWAQRPILDRRSLYLFAQAEAGVPATPVTLTAEVARQQGGMAGSYWTWSLGGRYVRGPFSAGLRFVDTDLSTRPHSRAGLVASVGFSF